MLHVHRAERADGLVDALAALLAQPLDGSVRARGDRRPDARDGALAHAAALDRARASRPAARTASARTWSSRRRGGWPTRRSRSPRGSSPTPTRGCPSGSCGRCWRSSTRALHEPWLQSLAAHLGATLDTADPARQARRFASVRHIAELFDRYALQRPAMIRAWAAGQDVDATGAQLPQDARWQAELWRRLRARAGQPDPAERIESACARLREEPGLVELPGPAVGVRAHAAAGRAAAGAAGARPPGATCTCSCCTPSPALWERVAQAPPITRRAEDVTRELPANRLLASWGQDVRELQLVAGPAPPHADHHHPTTPADRLAARRASRPACAPTARRPGRRSRTAPTSGSSSARTAASRSTPATAAPARSRCCATRSCTSSPRTRRSSRAT